jgi:hypothetical protein
MVQVGEAWAWKWDRRMLEEKGSMARTCVVFVMILTWYSHLKGYRERSRDRFLGEITVEND